MVTVIGVTFPESWQYGPEEIEILDSISRQVGANFAQQKNLLINTTWFGSQFDNPGWQQVEQLIKSGKTFDNLFLLSVIDPFYLFQSDLEYLQSKLQIKNIFRIGMFDKSQYEWNFHAVVGAKHCPSYARQDIVMHNPKHVFLLYQRKPRRHRVELTELLTEQGLIHRGIVTLGSNKNSNYDWSEGLKFKPVLIEDLPSDYKHNGKHDDFEGIPNDLVTLGRLDIWKNHFLNIVSETEFNNWDPTFVTEKTWKPMIGLRPFVIHGQRDIYNWLQRRGFKTFNHYWSHVPCETGEDQHGNVLSVIKFLCDKNCQELQDMYADMMPDLEYNRNRFFEFAQEQKYRIDYIFE
jgi:hypothetical protein